MYSVPSLIVFPGNIIPVSDSKQTEAFFASSWDQYEGVESVDKDVKIMAEAPGTVWADVTWTYRGGPQERFCYQLVEGAQGYQIGVLTPMASRCASPLSPLLVQFRIAPMLRQQSQQL